MLTLLLLVILTSSLAQAQQLSSNYGVENCSKPWFVWHNMTCQCSQFLSSIATCSNGSLIKKCYCMTVDEQSNKTVVGTCPYTCGQQQHWSSNETDLNNLCVDSWNRRGRLCSQCVAHHGPLVYSYSMQCIHCPPKVARESIAYFIVSFLLLTVFCLVIITLRISGARPPMSTFILVSQVMSAPQYMSLIFVPHNKQFVSSRFVSAALHDTCWKVFAAFFGLWNLDILRSFYPHICLSQNMSTLQVKFLEYVVALYPLVILLVVFFCVKLYNRGYRVIFCLCRPVTTFLARLRQTVNVQASLIDAFVTFIILSVNKIGYTSFIILQPMHLYSPAGNSTLHTYIDPTLRYFGQENLPYALMALFLTIVLIFIPLLLLFLYPLRSFQTFLNNRQWQCTTLHIFADSFQGCYKDGTNGTRDYRWFAGLHLLLRFIIVFCYDTSNYYYRVNAVLMVISIALYMVLLAIFHPYKKHLHLRYDMLLLFGLLLWCTALQVSVMQFDSFDEYDFAMHLFLLVLAALIPSVFFAGIILRWTIGKKLHYWMMLRLRRMNSLHGSMRPFNNRPLFTDDDDENSGVDT